MHVDAVYVVSVNAATMRRMQDGFSDLSPKVVWLFPNLPVASAANPQKGIAVLPRLKVTVSAPS